jgi:signal transduction histidine kinase
MTATVETTTMAATMSAEPTTPLRRWWGLRSARAQILIWAVAFLAMSTVASVLVVRQVLLVRLDERISATLTQEVDEFDLLVTGNDPETGRPFGSDLRRILEVYVDRNVPIDGEVVLGIVGNRVEYSTGDSVEVAALVEKARAWRGLERPVRSTIATDLGEARYLAIPVTADGDRLGAFVVGFYPAAERAAVDDASRNAALVALGVLVLGSLAAWVVAGRVLKPLRLLNQTARAITETDLTQRIPVRGDDELAGLARTFNDMLDRLQQAFATQRAFIDDAGHELRTPITIIRGNLEVSGDDLDEWQEAKPLVLDELDRMGRIVDDLLLLAKAEQPDFLQQGPIDLAEFTEEVAAKVRPLGDREWQLEETAHVVIDADRQRLTQAMVNLARNAVQHTAPGDLIALGSSANGDAARLWVRDEGPGVALDQHDLVFKRFARGAGTRRTSDGAGLGLSIVRAIADSHGGRVELISAPGFGATFMLVLPLERPEGEESA